MQIELERAVFKKGQFTPGKVSKMKIEVWALMTARVAKELGSTWLLDREQIVRGGWNSVDLEANFATATLTHTIDRISSISLEGCSISKMVARASKATKKKPKKLGICFTVEYQGNNLFLLEHWNKVATGEGTCEIKAIEQARLDDTKTGGKKVNMSGNKKREAQPGLPGAEVVELMEPVPVTTRYKDPKSKVFVAALSVLDVEGGFASNVTATIGTIRIKEDKFGPFNSESEARSAAANAVYEAASKMAKEGSRDQKRAGLRMAEWCMSQIAKQDSIVEATL